MRLTLSIEIFGPEPEGATPLTDADYLGLKPKWISTKSDLNQAEAQSISDAHDKYLAKRLSTAQILDALFVRELHSTMFSSVWSWAGQYRLVETTIGVSPFAIPEAVANLVADAHYWISTDDPGMIDAAVTRVHHRMVEIHPFRNGNGRFSRLYADLLLIALRRPVFTWGGGVLGENSDVRHRYVQALKAADIGDYSQLEAFVRNIQKSN